MKKIITISILLLSIANAKADGGSLWTIEYLPSSEYKSAIGFGIYGAKYDGIGYYGNFQLTISTNEPHYESLNINSFGDPVTDRYEDLMIFNVGITKRISSVLGGYLGVGYAFVEGFAEKYDPYHILSSNGYYYVSDTAKDESSGNVNAGILLDAGSVTINIGYHSFTSSAYFGIGGRF